MRRGSEIKFRFQFDRSHKGESGQLPKTWVCLLYVLYYVRVDRGDRQRYGGPRRNQTPHGDRETTDTLACLKSFVDEDGGEREGHFRATDTPWAPWHVIRSDDKKRPQLNTISHLFTQIPGVIDG